MMVIWVVARAFMVIQVGFWNDVRGVEIQDVNFFKATAEHLSTIRTMPIGDSWQYPPGAAFLLLIPTLIDGHYAAAFIAMMLAIDFAMLAVLLRDSRDGSRLGVWLWLLAIPILSVFSILRFDSVPTLFAVGALVVGVARPYLFGALVGIGAMIKAWPLALLIAQIGLRNTARSIAAVVMVTVVTFGAAALTFGDQSGFFSNQNVRGLQVESVPASPWYFRSVLTGKEIPMIARNGTLEVNSPLADATARALKWATVLAGLWAAAWWVLRNHAIARGRSWLSDPALGRDAVFVAMLLAIVTSRVLSPQFMIWLIGLTAVILGTQGSLLRRPAALTVLAIVMTAGIYASPANMVIRNFALVLAAIDAACILTWTVVRKRNSSQHATATLDGWSETPESSRSALAVH